VSRKNSLSLSAHSPRSTSPTTAKPIDQKPGTSSLSSDETSDNAVPGCEPTPGASSPTHSAIGASSSKLIGLPVTPTQTTQTQPVHPVVAAEGPQVPAALPGPPQLGSAQTGSARCCTGSLKYTVVAAVVGSIATTCIIVIPAFVDHFDEPDTEAIKTHLPLAVTLAFMGGAGVFGAAGRLYYWFFHRD
jgi:hypothetical protein